MHEEADVERNAAPSSNSLVSPTPTVLISKADEMS